MKKLISLFFVLGFVFGCEESVKDGKLPEKYNQSILKVTGSYVGQLESRDVSLTLNLRTDGFVELLAHQADGKSGLLADCHSPVGNLISVNADRDSQTVKNMFFDFNGSFCAVVAQNIELVFSGRDQLQVRIAKDGRWMEDNFYCSPDIYRPTCPEPRRYFVVTEWIIGQFQKVQN